jgi:hypothetical protein
MEGVVVLSQNFPGGKRRNYRKPVRIVGVLAEIQIGHPKIHAKSVTV